MQMAIDLSIENVANGGGPFGAVIVRDGEVIATGTNRVTANNDPTAHAEVSAIREACAKVGNFKLKGCICYTSCEPCPMCLSALYWAGVERIVYGNTKDDAKAINFDDSFIYDEIGKPYPREERAFECFLVAAEAGIPEACYKLGDMYKHGTGCEPDAKEAFRWYVRASELAAREQPVILGSIALRLAGCYEEGFGCEQSFSRALEWYGKAVSGLECAVEAGDTWYEKALAGARAGVKRCKQEVMP